MMHYDNCVVTLCDGNRRTFREYDSQRNNDGRKCKVHIPFDSEYQFYVKNNSSNRVRLDIFIDGSLVTNNGLIISGNTADHIERFLDTDKKFKFVRASNEAVTDPTSPENGIIKVIAHKEKPATIINWTVPYWAPYDPWRPIRKDMVPSFDHGYTAYSANNIGSSHGSSDIGSISTNSAESVSCASAGATEPGATVEGDFSNQTFGSTGWNGDDGNPITFSFYVVGAEPLADPVRERKMKEYLRLKEELRV